MNYIKIKDLKDQTHLRHFYYFNYHFDYQTLEDLLVRLDNYFYLVLFSVNIDFMLY